METPHQSSIARLAAVLALAVAFLVMAVIVVSSLGGGESAGRAGQTGRPSNAAAKPAKGSERKIYVVKPGDCCLSQIANKTGVDLERLESLNPHLDPQAIHSGDRVKLR
jgi:LysM repeat protein